MYSIQLRVSDQKDTGCRDIRVRLQLHREPSLTTPASMYVSYHSPLCRRACLSGVHFWLCPSVLVRKPSRIYVRISSLIPTVFNQVDLSAFPSTRFEIFSKADLFAYFITRLHVSSVDRTSLKSAIYVHLSSLGGRYFKKSDLSAYILTRSDIWFSL
jgi:hypothetical protein